MCETRKFCLNTGKSFFCQVDQTLEQVAWRGDGVSIPGDNQNPTGHGAELSALGGPA